MKRSWVIGRGVSMPCKRVDDRRRLGRPDEDRQVALPLFLAEQHDRLVRGDLDPYSHQRHLGSRSTPPTPGSTVAPGLRPAAASPSSPVGIRRTVPRGRVRARRRTHRDRPRTTAGRPRRPRSGGSGTARRGAARSRATNDVGDLLAAVAHLERDDPARRAVEQRAHVDAARVPRSELREQVREREPGVDEVLDEHDVAVRSTSRSTSLRIRTRPVSGAYREIAMKSTTHVDRRRIARARGRRGRSARP